MIPGNISLRKIALHQVARFFKALPSQVRFSLQEIANPLIMDVIGPARVDKAINGALDQDISQIGGEQNAGVVNDNRKFM